MVVDERAFVHAVHTILHRKTGYLMHKIVWMHDRIAIAADRRESFGQHVVVGLAEHHSVLEEAGGSVVVGVVQRSKALVTGQAVKVPVFVVICGQEGPVEDHLPTFEAGTGQ